MMRLQSLEVMGKRQIVLKTSLDRLIHGVVGLRLKEITSRRMFLLAAKDALMGRYEEGEMLPL